MKLPLGRHTLACTTFSSGLVGKSLSFGEGGDIKATPEAGDGTGGPAGSIPARARKGTRERPAMIPGNGPVLLYPTLVSGLVKVVCRTPVDVCWLLSSVDRNLIGSTGSGIPGPGGMERNRNIHKGRTGSVSYTVGQCPTV